MDTRDRIIRTAFIGFLENGYEGISLNEIIKRTGMTKGAFYYYFKNKEQLIKELIDKYLFSYLNIYGNSFISSSNTAEESLYAMASVFANMFTIVSKQIDLEIDPRRFYSLFMSALSKNKDVYQSNSSNQEDLNSRLKRVIAKGIRNGEFRQEVDADEVAFLCSSMLHGVLLDWVNDESIELEYSLRKGIKSIINIIRVE